MNNITDNNQDKVALPKNTIKKTTVNIVYDKDVDRVLMIKKRRNSHGFGDKGFIWKDKYNFPGGKVDEGENFMQGVVRETKEETGIMPLQIDMKGIINYNGLGFLLQNAIFLTTDFAGNLVNETEEATVEWVKRKNIPFDKMFQTDKLWVPKVWKDYYFLGSVTSIIKDDKNIQKLNYLQEFKKMSQVLKNINYNEHTR